jgi:hypothetical protein
LDDMVTCVVRSRVGVFWRTTIFFIDIYVVVADVVSNPLLYR